MEFNFKSWYLKSKLFFNPLFRFAINVMKTADTILCLLSLSVFIYQFGFNIPESQFYYAQTLYKLTFVFYFLRLTLSISRNIFQRPIKSSIFTLIYYLPVLFTFVSGWVLPQHLQSAHPVIEFFRKDFVIYFFTAIHVVFGLSRTLTRSLSKHINPNWLFVGSFLFLIFAGAGLLMLPNATTIPVTFHEALFTSVSAVCVTGLVVVDTATRFTLMGKIIILALIQAGGIGIMTFTSFFGLFSESRHSLQNQFVIKNMMNDEEGINHIFSGLRNIIFVTFFVELVGMGYLYYASHGQGWTDLWFAGFHSVSAFCNAGFSILPNGLCNSATYTNYSYLSGISVLIIIGGLGFPIIFNILTWARKKLANFLRTIIGRGYKNTHVPRILNTSTVIVLVTTLILLVSGTIVFYISEYNNTLANYDSIGKVVTAFFMSVTPRTAGFNSFSMTGLLPVSVLWMIFYMWIGASPMSTGGGIKTTTFSIAILNVWNTLRGRDRIEIRYREIAPSSVNRAFVIIFISIILIGASAMIISVLEPHIPIQSVVFECVSAISTVGLSLDVTPTLSQTSQTIIILLMFVGRIGFFTLLSCFIPQKTRLNYRLPYEHIGIN
ncbi:MAG: potassium transporter TrkG [Paludibacter sp.]|nr:potassium transporter TrkG [Paludibacter sp.]